MEEFALWSRFVPLRVDPILEGLFYLGKQLFFFVKMVETQSRRYANTYVCAKCCYPL